jgi:5-methylcytosine-specific restriction endonuclease McrA
VAGNHNLTEINPEMRRAYCSGCEAVVAIALKYRQYKIGYRCAVKLAQNRKTSQAKITTEMQEKYRDKHRPWVQYKKMYCEKCGFVPLDSCVLDVDHINGREIEDPHHPSNLQTLCANCHRLKTFRPDLV